LEKLIEKIRLLTPINTDKAVSIITGMICSDELCSPVTENDLYNALSIDGEYLVLQMDYDEFTEEFLKQNLKYKISQAISVIVIYEDNGEVFDKIKEFVTYISDITDTKQNSVFGIKKVDKLSKFPVTLLFSGILPINQLRMYIGSDIYNVINSDREYFQNRFKEFRDLLSEKIKLPILPLFPQLDSSLSSTEVILIDMLDGKIIGKFETKKKLDRNVIDEYLIKLYHLYIYLAKS